jgi:hypothetical protein
MKDIKEFYILGLPIETPIGECHFLKVKEYPDYFVDLQIVSMTKDHLINKYSEINKNNSLTEFIEELNKYNLFELALTIPELQTSYFRLFSKVFDNPNAMSKLTPENFTYFRKLILDMNGMKEEVINPNPEIQRAIERSKRVKSQEGEKLAFHDIVTSLVGYNGLTYDNINNFTIYQMYMTYYRIAQFKNYDTSTLFATVSDKVKVDSWSKHIDMFAEEKHFVSKDEFNKNTGSMFKE